MKLSLTLSAKDRLSTVIRSAVGKSDESFSRLEARLDGIASGFESIGKKSLIMGTAMMGAGALNLRNAANFEDGMASVSTLCDDATDDIKAMSKEVLLIGKRTPVALDQLTGALYDIRSAGIAAADQFNVLEKSAQLGVAGLGSTKEAVDLVTSSINAFKLVGEEQNKLYDNIFKTVKTGKTTISGLAQGFGAVAGTVAAAGIKIDDYLASIAALTTTGQPAAQAHTQMKAAIAGLTRNTKEQSAIFNKLGAKDFNDLIAKSGSVVNAFEGINRSVKGNKAKLIELLGSVEAYNAVLSLTGNQNLAYVQTIDAMRHGEDMFAAGYAKKLNTVNAQLQRGKNLISKISINFGTGLVPGFKKLLDGAERVINAVDALPESFKNSMSVGSVAIGAGLVAFGSLNFAVSFGIKQIKGFLGTYRDVSKFVKQFPIKPINATLWDTQKIIRDLKVLGTSIAGLPRQLGNVASGFFNCAKASVLALPGNVSANFRNLKSSLISFPGALKGVITSFRTLNITMSLNPVGIACAAIAGGALLIIKYWKPIKAYFTGLWRGLVEGTKPLHPIFKQIGAAVKPIFDWLSRLIKPVEALGTRAESWGYRVGKIVGGLITGVGNLIKNIVTLGGLLDKKKNKTFTVETKTAKVDGSHAGGLDRVPFDGYIAELHEGERVLTEREALQYSNSYNTSNPIYNITYNPVINAQNIKDIKELEALLERRERQLLNKLRTEERRRAARAYA